MGKQNKDFKNRIRNAKGYKTQGVVRNGGYRSYDRTEKPVETVKEVTEPTQFKASDGDAPTREPRRDNRSYARNNENRREYRPRDNSQYNKDGRREYRPRRNDNEDSQQRREYNKEQGKRPYQRKDDRRDDHGKGYNNRRRYTSKKFDMTSDKPKDPNITDAKAAAIANAIGEKHYVFMNNIIERCIGEAYIDIKNANPNIAADITTKSNRTRWSAIKALTFSITVTDTSKENKPSRELLIYYIVKKNNKISVIIANSPEASSSIIWHYHGMRRDKCILKYLRSIITTTAMMLDNKR